MHDGRFATLMDVVEFYNSGIQRHRILSPDLTSNGQVGGRPIRMNLSQEEKEALVAFMEALTDEDSLVIRFITIHFSRILWKGSFRL